MANHKPSHRAAERKAAKDRGEPHYFTGRPCILGHISKRATLSGHCIECRREGDRQRYAKNPEASAIRNTRRYSINKEIIKQRRREWYKRPENKEKARATRLLYESKRGEAIAEKARLNSASYRKRFPEKAKGSIVAWWARNPERKKTYARNRRARKRGNGGSHTQSDINEIFANQMGRCAYCKKRLGKVTSDRHVDHIIPLVEGGTNDRRNLQILCQSCNLEKGRRDPLLHARMLGMLL